MTRMAVIAPRVLLVSRLNASVMVRLVKCART